MSDFDDTTDQIIPWRPPPPQDVIITPRIETAGSFLDPDHTIAAPLDGTVAMRAPAPERGTRVRKLLGALLVFDIALGCFAIIALGRVTPPTPVGVEGTEPSSSTTFAPITTRPTVSFTVTTRVQTTAAPLTTMVPSTAAPKTIAVCKP